MIYLRNFLTLVSNSFLISILLCLNLMTQSIWLIAVYRLNIYSDYVMTIITSVVFIITTLSLIIKTVLSVGDTEIEEVIGMIAIDIVKLSVLSSVIGLILYVVSY